LPLVCADRLAVRASSVEIGESGVAHAVSRYDTAGTATVSDGSSYFFSALDSASSSTTAVNELSLVHATHIDGRGPLGGSNVHTSRGDYRCVVPADEEGGSTNVRIVSSDRVENAATAIGLSMSASLRVYDSDLDFVLEVSEEEAEVYPLEPGEYHLLAEAMTTYDGLSIPPGSDGSSLLRRSVSFRATVHGADLPRAAQNFADQRCSEARCPDVMGFWVFNLWAFLADNPAMRSDRGANAKRVWDADANADSPNDFVNLGVRPASAYTYVLPSAASTWDGRIPVPRSAGAVFCRLAAPPHPVCTGGAACGPIHTLHYPETIVVRKVPEERYYTATVATASGCAAESEKLLTLADSWPVATDSDDQIQLFMPDGGHPGPFASRFILQQIFEARQEGWFEPVANMVANGRMEDDCRTSGWTPSGDTACRLRPGGLGRLPGQRGWRRGRRRLQVDRPDCAGRNARFRGDRGRAR
jgi:hypothetical protein